MTSTALAPIDPAAASAVQIREWSIAIRERIEDMTEDELGQLEAVLIAFKTRLRQLGKDIDETERTRIKAVQRYGELLGKPEPEFRGNQHVGISENNETPTQATYDRRHQARLLAAYPEVVEKALSGPKPSLNKAVNLAKRQRAADEAAKVTEQMAAAVIASDDPEPPKHAKWWKLGEHLLYCGDSADQEFIDRCAGATFAFADPPYNAGKADWDHGFKWRHDYLADVAQITAVTPGISAIADFFTTTNMPYRWSIAAYISNGMTRGPLGFGNWIYAAVFSNNESIHRNAQDHLTLSVTSATTHEASHESRKPARLLVDLIELFTDKGDLVVDPFLGSGTTLFAAEQTGRRCIGAEISPEFCAEIIARYGEEARPE